MRLTPNTLRRSAAVCELVEIERCTEALGPNTYHLRRHFAARPHDNLIEINDLDRLIAFIERENLANVVIVEPTPEDDDPWAGIDITL